jgi:hypothetical protein
MAAAIALTIILLIILGILLNPYLTQRRRQRIQGRSFPAQWLALVEYYVPIYSYLTPEERQQLRGHIQVFLAEKQFIGCGGLKITEEIQVAIAAIACLLLLHKRGDYFPNLRTILVYPGAYLVTATTSRGPYIEEQRVARLGESWTRDQLVVSWQQTSYDASHWQDGHNVILHEFAHQLDQADGSANGVPQLRSQAAYTQWAKVMTHSYQQMGEVVERGQKAVMDSYGATSPAEFFAVATETFFEKPRTLSKHDPELYALLRDYYQLDPIDFA